MWLEVLDSSWCWCRQNWENRNDHPASYLIAHSKIVLLSSLIQEPMTMCILPKLGFFLGLQQVETVSKFDRFPFKTSTILILIWRNFLVKLHEHHFLVDYRISFFYEVAWASLLWCFFYPYGNGTWQLFNSCTIVINPDFFFNSFDF